MPLVSIVETQTFARDAASILDEDQLDALKAFLASKPEAGKVIPKSAGVRKLRWEASGRGKRGGSRVIYYYHNADAPLFLLSIFAKNQKSDLNAEELKAARQFAEAIAKEYRKRRE